SQQLSLTDRVRTTTDPLTGRPVPDSEPFAKSSNNFVYFGGVPILYWPRFSTSLERPAFYIAGVKIKNDRAFGTGALVDWDLFQLLGIDSAPKGVDWELSTDYLSDRGPALGTTLKYRLPGLFGVPGPVNGFFDTWVIDDRGNDRLGSDRLDLPPEETTRGRSLLRHRQYLPRGFEFIAEVGWLSDRNFLEQYFENEWDRETDHVTGLRLRKYYYNNLFEVSANAQVNDFFTETENLPSLDHYLLGGSLFGDRMTWSAHNRVAYSKLNVADAPTNPAEAAEQSPNPGEIDSRGVVASTRQELALPISTGPFRVVPFISGEAAHYGEAADGDSLTRLLGQTGVRASLPMARIDPTIQSSLLNVRGLAHKLEWTAEYFYADSDTNLDELPLYDPLDDNAQEQFRRRFIGDLYGGALPLRFDPRYYALRHGLQRSVVSPSDVIADDLQQFRIGLHQRFQTKRGLPGRERIVDLLQLDVDMLLFPDADRDNFGETVGPTTYNMRYHIGDRFTLLSDGYFDFFTDGLQAINAGIRASRPGVGDWYTGILSLEGPISSTVLRSSIDYRLNEKWIFSGGTTYDFGQTGNVGQSLGITRIGESLLVRLGVNVDSGRDNVGVGFSVEPRFWPSQRLGRLGGQLIPPPGVQGLE
ncbi:MAG: organic solvent tolerance protein OstA, partial [Pirellulaceae bacterium]|nr:organic solvent tolerance protein OstA [Pirellulaceae bacterium]